MVTVMVVLMMLMMVSRQQMAFDFQYTTILGNYLSSAELHNPGRMEGLSFCSYRVFYVCCVFLFLPVLTRGDGHMVICINVNWLDAGQLGEGS